MFIEQVNDLHQEPHQHGAAYGAQVPIYGLANSPLSVRQYRADLRPMIGSVLDPREEGNEERGVKRSKHATYENGALENVEYKGTF